MPQTPNHGYNVPNEGQKDWHEPLNENFRQYDTDIEIRDRQQNVDDYEPNVGAKFFATDTGLVLIGDGSQWNPVPTTGPTSIFEQVRIDDRGPHLVLKNEGDFLGSLMGETADDYGEIRLRVTDGASGRHTVLTAGSDGGLTLGARDGTVDVSTDLEVGGDTGIGTSDPKTRLHVRDSVSDVASAENHVALVENTADGNSDDVLALKTNENPPGSGNNYVSFKDASGPVGAIEGDGNGGVTTASAGNDYAEWLPRRDPDETIEAGDVVGVHAGEVSLETADADRAMVVSTQPIVTGNDPGPAAEDREGYEKVAFVGQAPARIRGPVDSGDLVVPSGAADGTARAVAPAGYGPADGPVVGQAWERAGEGVTEVTVAVGLEAGEAHGATVERRARRIDELEAENERKDERIDELERRLATLEERTARLDAGGNAPASADD